MMPPRIEKLPRDEKGRPIPFFVQWIDGKPDFRVADPEKYYRCVQEKLCWVCGERLGTYQAFVVGPMCAINHVSSEPPSHLECAVFSVQACPFLATPKMHRRERDLPEGVSPFGGVSIRRNPGVSLVWVTKSWFLQKDGQGGAVCRFGDPTRLHWFCEGRLATRAEVEESIRSGLPILEKTAADDGPQAQKALRKGLAKTMQLLPEA